MAKTATRTNLLTSQSLAGGAAAVRSAVLDCTGVDGGFITAKLTNGTGPTVQCTVKLLFAHKQTSAPTAAAEGTAETDWKVVVEIGAGTATGGVARLNYSFGPEKAGYYHLEFGGNTVNAVTIEGQATTIVY